MGSGVRGRHQLCVHASDDPWLTDDGGVMGNAGVMWLTIDGRTWAVMADFSQAGSGWLWGSRVL